MASDDSPHIGALSDDLARIVDFTASDTSPVFRDMLALIDGGAAALDVARQLRERSNAVVLPAAQHLLAPVAQRRPG